MEGGAHRGVVAADAEHAEAGQEVEVLPAAAVVQVGALGAHVGGVEPDRVQHPGQLRVHVPAVQLVALLAPLVQQAADVETHACSLPAPLPGRERATMGA